MRQECDRLLAVANDWHHFWQIVRQYLSKQVLPYNYETTPFSNCKKNSGKVNIMEPTIEFFDGIHEKLSDVSLRKYRDTGDKIVLMKFQMLRCLEQFKSFTKSSSNVVHLKDEEGDITITPSATRLLFGGPEGDDIKGVEVEFEIHQSDHLERFMRFMDRYAQANNMAYGT
jgi:photosystem II Psb28-2 protein